MHAVTDRNATFNKRSVETVVQSATSLLVILTTYAGIVFARIATHKLCTGTNKRFLAEFVLIVVPGVLFVTVASDYAVHFVAVMVLLLAMFVVRTRALSRARRRAEFDLGRRPTVLTIVRALTHLITAICILAIDFKSFHRPYRKRRQYGASLMDTGIGLFVVTMGLVSRRPRQMADMRRSLVWTVLPLLLLGLGRTLVILAIDYNQDAHEYGQHLNAFFTLGLTKLCGSLLSAMVRTDFQLLPLGLGLLIAHQVALCAGLSNYVMDDNVVRSNLFAANREGLIALPGFVAAYLISICFSRLLLSQTLLTHTEMTRKLNKLLAIAASCWLLVVASAFLVGIARVTCSLGYVAWVFAIMSTMLWLSMFLCDFIINSVMPTDTAAVLDDEQEQGLLLGSKARSEDFIICGALNMNGLTFFMLANLLTGGVNIFLKPEHRSNAASVCILLLYMLFATSVAYLLHRRGVRIA